MLHYELRLASRQTKPRKPNVQQRQSFRLTIIGAVFQKQTGVSVLGTIVSHYSLFLSTSKDVAMQKMKKLISVIVIVAMLTLTMLCVGAVSAAEGPVSPGPEGEGDGVPEGSQWGPGPAPSAGDGEQEGPEWPDWP